jgi:DNA-binding Lrp family transcriptional regulator
MTPSAVELALIDRWQRDFPLEERPFAIAGAAVGLDEETAISTFDRLIAQDIITRIGAIVRPHTVGASTLAAMQVPPSRLDEVAAIVSAEPFASHNYQREHALNLWFVIAAPRADDVGATLGRIARVAGLEVLDLPLVEAYHLDLGFPLTSAPKRPAPCVRDVRYQPDANDRNVLGAIEEGLPLTPRPYRYAGGKIGLGEGEVIARMRKLAETGVVSRFGCVVRHRSLGYTANAMAVWDVPDEIVGRVAHRMTGDPRVTLCYRRRRRRPDWPYNLFCMVHAKSRADALATIGDLNAAAETGPFDQSVLFSTRCFKQRGAVFSDRQRGGN